MKIEGTSRELMTGFSQAPDMGFLKRNDGQYGNLQNVRGWGKLGTKRQGVDTRDTLDYGVMGIFDAFRDGDPTSPNKLFVITQDGSMIVYDPTELLTTFDWVLDSVSLYLQSPDLTWWAGIPDSGGTLNWTASAAPASSQATDFVVAQSQIFGFKDSTGIWRMSCPASILTIQRYGPTSALTTFSTPLAITTAAGIVFQDSSLNFFKVTIDNSGITTITAI
jgi:hypothetical protein